MDKSIYKFEVVRGSVTCKWTSLLDSPEYAIRSAKERARCYGKGAKWRVWSGKWERKGVVA